MCYNSVTTTTKRIRFDAVVKCNPRRTNIIRKERFGLAKNAAVLEYKGHPLRRKDNLIYYGSMADKYIIMMQITQTKKVKDMDVATNVIVQLQHTDPNVKSKDMVVKKTEKSGLYEAMDIATVWLDRALAAE